MPKCNIRLLEISNAAKPAPTRLEGSQVAMGNAVRRRVAKTVNHGNYGPLFGLGKNPMRGKCKNYFTANSGASSDVTEWKRLYGGYRHLKNSGKPCDYGCSS